MDALGAQLLSCSGGGQRARLDTVDVERQRRVDVLAVSERSDASFVVDLRCMHGTYVKEWVSGDDGRTDPSLAELLGVGTECAVLDVLDILTES